MPSQGGGPYRQVPNNPSSLEEEEEDNIELDPAEQVEMHLEVVFRTECSIANLQQAHI